MLAPCGPFTCTKHRLLVVAFAALSLILLIDITRTRSWRRRQAALSDVVGAQVTVVMMSKSNGLRKNQLALVGTYANHPLVDKFVWVWNVRTDEPLLRSLLPYTTARVEFVHMPTNSLNNRWLVSKYVETDAVLYLEDDHKLLHESCLHCLYHQWRNNTDVLQGIRGHYIQVSAGGQVTDYWSEEGAYNMVVPNHLLIHRKYLEEYASPRFEAMRTYVDVQAAHCDDFFVNFMVAAHTHTPHHLLQVRNAGPVQRLQDAPQRKELRLECLRHIAANFGFIPKTEMSERYPQCLLCNPIF